jgi:hypothetical protein
MATRGSASYQQQSIGERSMYETDDERGGLLQQYTPINRCKHMCSTRAGMGVVVGVVVVLFIAAAVLAAHATSGSSPAPADEASGEEVDDGMETLPGTMENLAMDSSGALTEYVTLVRLPCADGSVSGPVRHDYDITGLAWSGVALGLGNADQKDTWRRHGLVYNAFAKLVEASIQCATPIPAGNRCLDSPATKSAREELKMQSQYWTGHMTTSLKVPVTRLAEVAKLLDDILDNQFLLVDLACKGADTTDVVSDAINSAGALGAWFDEHLSSIALISSTPGNP